MEYHLHSILFVNSMLFERKTFILILCGCFRGLVNAFHLIPIFEDSSGAVWTTFKRN